MSREATITICPVAGCLNVRVGTMCGACWEKLEHCRREEIFRSYCDLVGGRKSEAEHGRVVKRAILYLERHNGY